MTPADDIALYLYGDRSPGISAAMIDPGFRRLLRHLFANEEVPLPDPPPAALQAAIELGLFQVERCRYRAGSRLVVIPAHAEEAASQLMRPALAQYVEIASDLAAQLKAEYVVSAAAERFSWSDVAHTLMAGMFLDLAMGIQIYRSGKILRPPVGDSVVWAFERVSARNPYGVQWYAAQTDRAFVAQLWHWQVKRQQLRLDGDMVDLLVGIGTESGAGRHAGATARGKDFLYLRHLGFLHRENGTHTLQVPVFGSNDTGRLLPILEEGARRLVEDAIVPSLEFLEFSPWWRQKVRQDPYRHAAVRLTLEYGIDCTIGSKVLASFPEGPASSAWGRWIWIEPEGPRTMIASLATRRTEAPVP